jgi:hypothetical protein
MQLFILFVKSLLQAANDRQHEFDEATRISALILSNLNDTDRITFDEKLTLIKEKHDRLIDNLSQRATLLDEGNRSYSSR